MISLERRSSYRPESDFPPDFLPQLSRRQRQVAQLIADGKTNKQIAAALGITPESVRTYMKRVIARLAITEGEPRVMIARTVIFAWSDAA